jgi:UDP-glucose 4-epimerase
MTESNAASSVGGERATGYPPPPGVSASLLPVADRALVTGAAGFMGSHVVDACLERGLEVVAVDDLSGGYRENVTEEAKFVEGDVRDAELVKSLWSEHGPYRFVHHLAAYAAEGLSHFIRAWNYRTNLEASVNLINQSVLGDVERFVFTSSIAVYGAGQVPMKEDMVPVPEDPYGISKWAVELDLAAAREMFGLDYTIFRPHNVYGERQNIADPYRNVIGIFMNAVLRGQPMPVFGDGKQTRAFSHISDVAPIIAESPFVEPAANETFNVGADTPYTILQLADEVARALEVEPEIVNLPARNEVVHAFSDHSKVQSAFSPPPPLELGEGIDRMAAWVKEFGSRDPIRFQGSIEVDRNMPPSWRDTQVARAQ